MQNIYELEGHTIDGWSLSDEGKTVTFYLVGTDDSYSIHNIKQIVGELININKKVVHVTIEPTSKTTYILHFEDGYDLVLVQKTPMKERKWIAWLRKLIVHNEVDLF